MDHTAQPRTPVSAGQTVARRAIHVLEIVSPRLAARVADRIWFTPGMLAPRKRRPLPEDTIPATFQFNGGELSGYDSRHGDSTVLLIHGWAGNANQLRHFVDPLRTGGYRVVGFDLPAHGSSPGHVTNLFEAADAITAVAEQLEGVDAIIAHSMGSIAAAKAVQRGLSVRTLAFLAPAVDLDFGMSQFRGRLGFSDRTETALRSRIQQRFGRDIWQELRLDVLAADLVIPGLIAHDTDDAEVPYNQAADVAAAWKTSEFMATSGLGHHGILRSAEVIDSVVAAIQVASAALRA